MSKKTNNIQFGNGEITDFDKLISDIANQNFVNNINDFMCNDNEININLDEKEFFEIIDAGKKGLHKKAGRYQEKLYGNYINAIKESDEGYINDVLYKAAVFSKNKEEILNLMKNEKFNKEWRNNFGNISPLTVLNDTGEMFKINYIKELI